MGGATGITVKISSTFQNGLISRECFIGQREVAHFYLDFKSIWLGQASIATELAGCFWGIRGVTPVCEEIPGQQVV